MNPQWALAGMGPQAKASPAEPLQPVTCLTLSFPLQMRTTALTGTQTWRGPLSPASPRRQHPTAGAGRAPSTSAPASQVQRLAEEEAGNQSLSLDLSVRVPRPCSAIPPLCSQLPIFSLVVLVYLHLARCLLNTS